MPSIRGSISNHKPITYCTCATIYVSLVAIHLQWRALYWKTKYLLHCIVPSPQWIFLKLHTYHWLPMHFIWYKCVCNRSIMKGTLLEEQSTFYTVFCLRLRDLSDTPHLLLTAHVPHLLWLWLQSVHKEWHFPGETKYLLHYITPSVRGIYLKLHTYHLLRMLYNWYKFGCNQCTEKGNFLEEQSIFSAVSCLLFHGSISNYKTIGYCTHATIL